MNMKTCILGLVLLCSTGSSWSQSYHFSQFFSTPLLTNPANTGFTEGPYRVASNFRSQGLPSGSTYFTGYLSGDVSPLRSSLPAAHKAGMGLYLMNDQSLNSAVQTNSVGLSAAYSVGLDTYGENSIGLGVQATYNQRRIDYSRLTFENQYGSGGYNAALPVGEPLAAYSRQFFDVNAGVMYNAALEHKSFFAGFSVYNLLGHKDNLLPDEFKMSARYVLQAGAQFFTGEYGKVYFSLTNMLQAGANETTLGGAYGMQLNDGEKNELMGGLWYRYKDAVIPYIGYQRSTVQVGLSFDYTVSALKTASQIRNAYELTLIYKAADNRELKTQVPWY